ncbi:uncharacterized protein LOC143422911 [Xylocopa sonorina]|uniref:uncharacterized protein LOC143422911 n=1 Tax=Xylocopa sonorina TaxID=1818115 RepID=UPI00403ACD56
MHSSASKLLLIFVLCVGWWSCAKGDNTVTINSFSGDVPVNEVIESLDYGLANNLVDATINVKKNCPDVIELEIRVFQGDDMVNQVKQKYDKPVRNLEDLCSAVDTTDPEEDSCTLGLGEQVVKECNIAKLFNDMSAGDYRTEVDITEGIEKIATLVVEVTVEEGE